MVINLNEQYNGGFLPDILMLTQTPIVVWLDGIIIVYYYYLLNYLLYCLLKKNLMHLNLLSIPQSGGKNVNSWKYKTSSWHLNGFPDGNNIGSTV